VSAVLLHFCWPHKERPLLSFKKPARTHRGRSARRLDARRV